MVYTSRDQNLYIPKSLGTIFLWMLEPKLLLLYRWSRAFYKSELNEEILELRESGFSPRVNKNDEY